MALDKPPMAVYRTCQSCQGAKVTAVAAYCAVCNASVPVADPFMSEATTHLPCNHGFENLITEYDTCLDCSGRGETKQWISAEMWQARQRQRLVRSLIPLAILVGFALMVAALVLDRDPAYACGSWWYGLILVGLWLRWPSE